MAKAVNPARKSSEINDGLDNSGHVDRHSAPRARVRATKVVNDEGPCPCCCDRGAGEADPLARAPPPPTNSSKRKSAAAPASSSRIPRGARLRLARAKCTKRTNKPPPPPNSSKRKTAGHARTFAGPDARPGFAAALGSASRAREMHTENKRTSQFRFIEYTVVEEGRGWMDRGRLHAPRNVINSRDGQSLRHVRGNLGYD